jgi:hypothetical protein
LAHVIPNALERTYKRTTMFDRRRQLMAAWSKFSASPAKPVAGDIATIGGAR